MRRECLQVRSNGLILFDMSDLRNHQRYNLQEDDTERYSGIMTNHARKRLSCALDVMIQRNPPRRIFNPISETHHDFSINFVTLTLSGNKGWGAKQGYDKLLSKWLRYMRDKYSVREYVWKCELQQNGRPHWHVATNEFIPWQVIRWKWNSLQKQEGLLQAYARKYGNFNPNSTDIHAVEKVQDIHRYISKEITKSTFLTVRNGMGVNNVVFDKKEQIYRGEMYEQSDPEYKVQVTWDKDRHCIDYPDRGMQLVETRLDSKVWDCSEVLKRNRFSTELDYETRQRLRSARWSGEITEEETDFCRIIKTLNPLKYLSPALLQDYHDHIN